jgi:hypothetical protein
MHGITIGATDDGWHHAIPPSPHRARHRHHDGQAQAAHTGMERTD